MSWYSLLNIACQHLEFSLYQKESRCTGYVDFPIVSSSPP